MRADRLLSILLLLQAHGRMSASTLARRLEVSRRTIYRDLEALSAAGVPVVTDQGPNGGASLLPGWRTDVTGLTESEISALLAFATSGPASDLGLGEDLGRAAQKVAVAAGSERAGSRFQDRVLIDNKPWLAPRRVPVHLARIQDAVWSDQRLAIRYRRADGQVSERTVDPYGLIAKNGVWYILAGGESGLRTYRVSRVEDAAVTGATFERPEGFDLERAWANATANVPTPKTITVTLRADPRRAGHLYRSGSPHIRDRGEGDMLVMEFPADGAAVAYLAAFGNGVEVLSPPQVREALAALGAEIVALYATGEPAGG